MNCSTAKTNSVRSGERASKSAPNRASQANVGTARYEEARRLGALVRARRAPMNACSEEKDSTLPAMIGLGLALAGLPLRGPEPGLFRVNQLLRSQQDALLGQFGVEEIALFQVCGLPDLVGEGELAVGP